MNKVYVNRDLLLEKAKGTDAYFQIKSLLTDICIADVAPRVEVAREIFADLDIIIQELEQHIYKNAKFGELMTDGPDLIVSWGQFLMSDYAELKKKYTEDSK